MTTLYLIRHAEARGNVDRIFQGHVNSDITEKGEYQLKLLANKFKDIDYDCIYSSDLTRAFKTACAVNHKSLKITTSENLREINGGKWEDMPFADIPRKYPNEYNIWDKNMHLLQMPEGESFSDFASRVTNEINTIMKKNVGKTVVIASHGTAVRAYLCYAKYLEYSKISSVEWADNTAISKFTYDEYFNIETLIEGDSSHLGDDMSTIKAQDWYQKINKDKQVITVTLNTCIDKNIFVDKMEVGGLNRISKTTINYVGKGITVSNALSNLFVETTATGFMGINSKNEFVEALNKYNIKNEFINVKGDTRVNIKILEQNSNTQTEFNDCGFYIDENSKQLLKEKLKSLCNNKTIVVISGSNPPNINFEYYSEILEIITKSGALLVVDSEKEMLKLAIEKKAFIIKPNLFELETLLGLKLNSLDEIKNATMTIVNKGVKNVIITMGKDGAVYANDKICYYIKAPKVKVLGLVGAGDSALAGFIAGYVKNKTFEHCALLSVTAATASVITEGTNPPEVVDIEKFLNKIKLIEL